MSTCYTGTEVPTPIVEPCKGVYTSTDCIASPNALAHLSLAEGASQTDINAALTAALLYKDQEISDLNAAIIVMQAQIDLLII